MILKIPFILDKQDLEKMDRVLFICCLLGAKEGGLCIQERLQF